jgi:hypothetical protein
MAHMKQLKLTFEANEKTWVLSFRCNGGSKLTSKQIKDEMKNIGWVKVAGCTSVYRKIINDDNFTEELNNLKQKLTTFRSDDDDSDVEFVLSVFINFNEVGDSIEGVGFFNLNNE